MFLLDKDYYNYAQFFTCAHIQIFFHQIFLIIGPHIVFISILDLLSSSL